MKLVTIRNEDKIIIDKQIKLQKKGIILFPLVALIFIMMSIEDYQGPNIVILSVFISYAAFIFIYSPLSKAILIGKTFQSINILDDNTIEFTTFPVLWRKEKRIKTRFEDVKINTAPLPKLLYKKYLLNKIVIENKIFFIFNYLLVDSGIVVEID